MYERIAIWMYFKEVICTIHIIFYIEGTLECELYTLKDTKG